MAVTEAEKRILQSIIDLTKEAQGRPPTLAEITVRLGYPASSRGNIQRQLQRLRPTYVDWEKGSRTIHVTPAGEDLVRVTPSSSTTIKIDLPLPEDILPLLASGLTTLVHDVNNGKPIKVPYPQALQRGLDKLAIECHIRQVLPPRDFHDALLWFQRPISLWPVSFTLPSQLRTQALLDEDSQPTGMCREYALQHCDAEMEACEETMVKVMSECKRLRRPDAYVKFRQTLIEHPLMTHDELIQLSFDPEIGTLGAYLPILYEQVPLILAEQGKIQVCRFCGWTLQRLRGHVRCGDDRCSVLTGDFMQQSLSEHPELPGKLQRVRRAIRRYVVLPGIYEVNTMRQLHTMGLSVDLWPNYDAYDLRITFPDGATWAIDVKDWHSPHLLARKLKPIDQGPKLRALYVVPDQRVREYPGYLEILRNASAGQPFSVLTIEELLMEAKQYKELLHA